MLTSRKPKYSARFKEAVQVATFAVKRVIATNPRDGTIKRKKVSAEPASHFEKGNEEVLNVRRSPRFAQPPLGSA